MSKNILRFLVSPCKMNLVWLPYVLCIAGFGFDVFILRHFADCVAVVSEQAASGIYIDWYAPTLAATYRLLIQLQEYCGFGTSVQVQGLPYLSYVFVLWGGFLLLLHSGRQFWQNTAAKPRWMLFVILFFLLTVWSQLVILSKTTDYTYWNLAYYMFASGLLLNMPKQCVPKVMVGLMTLLFLYYGTALRHNLIFSLFPLLCWLAWNFLPDKQKTEKPFSGTLLIVCVSAILWGGYLFLNQYINYSVLKTYRMYVLQERFYADIFMLNYYAPQHYKNPPNTFGCDFDKLSKDLFMGNYDFRELYVQLAFGRINKALQERDEEILKMVKESVKVLPEKEFSQLKTPKVYFDSTTRKLNDTPPGGRLNALNEREVVEQYPKDYILLRDAWIERIKQDPLIYLRVKALWWLRTLFLGRSDGGGALTNLVLPEFYPIRLCSGNLANGFTMFCIASLFCLYTFSKRRLTAEVMPFLMLSWSALFTILPLFIFLPDDSFRYLFWHFAASFLSITLFCANSPLFAEVMQTIQQYLEKQIER